MARPPIKKRQHSLTKLVLLQQITTTMLVLICAFYYFIICLSYRFTIRDIMTKEEKRNKRIKWMFELTMASDAVCISELRMNRATFQVLCDMVTDIGGLKPTKNTSIEEIVAMFLYTLAHHNKSRSISLLFYRSRETVSRQFHQVLLAVLRLHHILLKKPEPITKNCQDDRWKHFQGCLGALDGTLIKVRPPSDEKPRYRTRKGCISTNVLGVCCPNMQFIYVLPGWEGSAHDGRVLRDAVSRPHGLKVPNGNYYLVDAGYCNANGFLAPYQGQRYHLKEFDNYTPETAEECFNHKHAKARNVIERCFGLLKGRWKILASPSYFPIQTQVRIISACCLLHNLIRKFMSHDPQESESESEGEEEESGDESNEADYVTNIAPNDEWLAFRNNMAATMFNS
ncbi:protein ALP1-like [Rutidosis leptorrhynchoides]|uniref:protein ALP1-like n=1 Tax=Rutidosis leptorrhynchoides TaxID=125765 RepID=UPI003A994200